RGFLGLLDLLGVGLGLVVLVVRDRQGRLQLGGALGFAARARRGERGVLRLRQVGVAGRRADQAGALDRQQRGGLRRGVGGGAGRGDRGESGDGGQDGRARDQGQVGGLHSHSPRDALPVCHGA